MKKFTFSLILLLSFSSLVHAQIDATANTTAIGLGATSTSGTYKFTYQSNSIPHYGLSWFVDQDVAGGSPMGYLSGFAGLKFFTGGAVRMSIVNGNVGIGTTSPATTLDVNGSLKIQQGNFLYQNNNTGTQTRILGIHSSNYLYVGAMDAPIAGIVFRTNTGQDKMWIDGTTGNVGIGTGTPIAGLTTETGASAAIAPLSVVPNGSAWIGGAGTSGGITMGQFTANYGYIQSRNKSAANPAYNLVLNPLGGNIGIGTTAPDEKLVVNGNIKTVLESTFNPTKNVAAIKQLGLSGATGAMNWTLRGVYQYSSGVLGNADGGDLDIIKSQDGNIILGTKTDGTALGKIGVGTIAPVSAFQVGNGSVSVSMGSANTADLNYGTGYVGFNAARGASSWFITSNSVNNGGGLIYADIFGNINMAPIASNGTGVQTLADQDIKSRIAFQITSAGIVRAKQIKVELNGWPDYVFKKDYQLPSLQAVKVYIDQNHHLPEIPSEEQIAKDGLNLGEMNKLLMKKMEEMTLYMIEAKQEINDLKKQVQDLKKQIR